MKAKPSAFVFLYREGGAFPDVEGVLSGELRSIDYQITWALPALHGRRYALSQRELMLFLSLDPESFNTVDECDEDLALSLGNAGVVLLDTGDLIHAEFNRREEKLRAEQWNVYSAVFHFMTRWEDFHLDRNIPPDLRELGKHNFRSPKVLKDFVASFGLPPPHFRQLAAEQVVEKVPLPLPDSFLSSDQLLALLRDRRTCREYDERAEIEMESFSKLLYMVFGCHGFVHVYDEIWGIKRTSPSGGGLHPADIFLLIIRVRGMEPGLYYYRSKDHELDLIERLTVLEASELANEFTAGQSYPRWCGALFIMTARFYRNFWKYRRHPRAYPVLYMDCAHLSQTFYLACAHLGLGAFVTGAINGVNIEKRLKLDGYSEAPLLVSGCGIPLNESVGLDPIFTAFYPSSSEKGTDDSGGP
ncbi:putative peptide maturation dehydrogenase [Rhizobium leguminosarum]|uniref:putative peptide maturation dehydrogenase n=1 Tax=Rhizobium leguminosarum TaxID=384 RepID=UPI001C940D02|nr:putative peptide maturation dehydrogenase [Rhizobium leguminosarum]MBY5809237.1 putative peptide maturation dehydrogenase [Rhizobium leguminosarum]